MTLRHNTPIAKRCPACAETKPRDEFYSSNRYDGLSSECKECNKSRNRKSYRDDPAYGQARRDYQRKLNFNISPEQFAQLVIAQDDKCGLCGRPDPGGRGTWHVDHDHACCPSNRSCGKCIRGLLCNRCNMGLGQFLDREELLQSAIEYLRRPPLNFDS